MKDLTARSRVLAYLQTHGRIEQPDGRATAALKDAVGYQGSQLGFAQLIAAMSKSGQVRRDIRGKRTYGISLCTRPDAEGSTPRERLRTASLPEAPAAALGGERVSAVPAARRIDPEELADALLSRAIRATLGGEHERMMADTVRRLDIMERRLDELGAQIEGLISTPALRSGRHVSERLSGAELMYLQDLVRETEPVVRDQAN